MVQKSQKSEHVRLRLVWIYSIEILKTFIVAPRLEITKEMRNLGWDVNLIAPGPIGKHVIQGVDILCFPQPKIYLIRNFVFHYYVIRYILQNWKQINVIMFSQMSVLWILPLRLVKGSRSSYPILVMDTRTVPMAAAENATFKDKIRGSYSLLMDKMANRFAEGHTTITERMADQLSIPKSKLLGTWPSGVNRNKFIIAAQKRKWPGEKDSIVIIYIGTLNYERNLMALCRAVIEANNIGMDFVLWLYGDGTEKDDLKAFADQSDGQVKVYDVIPNERMPEVLARAHVGALPFPDEEKYRVSSPIKLFEYMGAGMPILATKIVCHTDVMGNGNYVFWADDSDVKGLLKGLQKTWQARTRLEALGKEALLASKDWTWAASAKRLDAALKYGLSSQSH